VKSILRRRPSPALAISCIALFVSLSGVSYGVATGFIDSREIRNNTITSGDVRNNTLRTFDIRNNEVRGFDIRNSTIQGRDVAFNTLTGADVNESSFGKVPSATQADSAAAVGGMTVQKFFAKPAPGTAAAEILRTSTFVLEAGCSGAGFPILQIEGLAGAPATNVTGATLQQGGGQTFVSDDALEPGDHLGLIPSLVKASGTATVSTSAGALSTIVYAGEDSPAFTNESVCAIRGTVTSG
jgi:hypothetical protein